MQRTWVSRTCNADIPEHSNWGHRLIRYCIVLTAALGLGACGLMESSEASSDDLVSLDDAGAEAAANRNPMDLARTALRRKFGSLEGVQIINVRAGETNSICGDLRTASGLERRFIVTPAGSVIMTESKTIAYADPLDSFAGYYLALCATSAERATAQEEIKAAAEAEALALAKEVEALDATAAGNYVPFDEPTSDATLSPPKSPSDARPLEAAPRDPPSIRPFSDAVLRPKSKAAE